MGPFRLHSGWPHRWQYTRSQIRRPFRYEVEQSIVSATCISQSPNKINFIISHYILSYILRIYSASHNVKRLVLSDDTQFLRLSLGLRDTVTLCQSSAEGRICRIEPAAAVKNILLTEEYKLRHHQRDKIILKMPDTADSGAGGSRMSHWSRLESCCWCISLETGTRIIGAVFLIISLGNCQLCRQCSQVLLFFSNL